MQKYCRLPVTLLISKVSQIFFFRVKEWLRIRSEIVFKLALFSPNLGAFLY